MGRFFQNISAKLPFLVFLFSIVFLPNIVMAMGWCELDTMIMQSTFRIRDGARDEKHSEEQENLLVAVEQGTAFILVQHTEKPIEKPCYVLVTADHVLRDMKSDTVRIYLREKKEDGTFSKLVHLLEIRHKGKEKWVKNSSLDIAAMHVRLPERAYFPGLSTEFLADAKSFKKYEIHHGDRIRIVGYPKGRGWPFGLFPIFESGSIASRSSSSSLPGDTFLCDAKIKKGYSGSPVYFVEFNRYYGGKPHKELIQLIIGMVVASIIHFEAPNDGLSQDEKPYQSTNIISSYCIMKTIKKLFKSEIEW